MMKIFHFFKAFFLLYLISVLSTHVTSPAYAGPQGTTYEIKDYGFGTGGANNLNGSTYGINALAGEQSLGKTSGTTYQLMPGLIATQLAYVPPAPTVTNPGTNYDRLLVVINQGNNPSDTTYAISISTDNFAADIRYVKSDGTVGSTLAATDFKTYASWGAASGTWVTGLVNNTTYYFRIKARHGKYSDSLWGISANVATANPTLTFTLSASSITFNKLTPGNSYTDSSQSTTFTTSTNSYNGYTIYGKVNQQLTSLTGTIPNYVSPNSAPTSWSGIGFGYTTNDTNLGGSGGANRFSNGTLYAGLQTIGSGDPVADNSGPVTSTPITNEQFTASYRITASNTTPAGTYTNVIIYTIVPQY